MKPAQPVLLDCVGDCCLRILEDPFVLEKVQKPLPVHMNGSDLGEVHFQVISWYFDKKCVGFEWFGFFLPFC